jgi:hypothetical protein
VYVCEPICMGSSGNVVWNDVVARQSTTRYSNFGGTTSMSTKVSTVLSQLRYETKNTLVQHPMLYLPIARVWRGSAVSSNTDIVIEGFPRSANSFASVAFTLAQPRSVRLAHHLHAAAQVVAAAKMEIPALVLIRDPEEAILSRMLLVAYPYATVGPAMKEYLRFYEPLLPYRDQFVLASFDSVVRDFGTVTRAINAKFETSFGEFEHTDANVAKCFEIMERRNAQLRGKLTERTVSRPSAERKEIKHSLRGKFHQPQLSTLRERVYGVYTKLMRDADV